MTDITDSSGGRSAYRPPMAMRIRSRRGRAVARIAGDFTPQAGSTIMTHPSSHPPASSAARCRSLAAHGRFNLQRDAFECAVCPFDVSGRQGIHVTALVTVHSPTARTSEFIEVVCQAAAGGWYRSYLYRRVGAIARVNVIMYTDDSRRTMAPGRYLLAFRLQVRERDVFISAAGQVAQR
jgi:hypothetical protein